MGAAKKCCRVTRVKSQPKPTTCLLGVEEAEMGPTKHRNFDLGAQGPSMLKPTQLSSSFLSMLSWFKCI